MVYDKWNEEKKEYVQWQVNYEGSLTPKSVINEDGVDITNEIDDFTMSDIKEEIIKDLKIGYLNQQIP